MNKILLAFLIIPFMSFSQGIDLELNQVLLINLNNTNTTYTVPEGKVWKVESVLIGTNTGTSYIFINGEQTYFHIADYNFINGSLAPDYSTTITKLPLWLPENTEVSSGDSDTNQLSVLEFNTVSE